MRSLFYDVYSCIICWCVIVSCVSCILLYVAFSYMYVCIPWTKIMCERLCSNVVE